jgi:predicted ArsR family transcriptional regulator
MTKAKTKSTQRQPKPAAPVAAPKRESKQAIIINLLKREEGATLDELIKATEWKPHSVRGHLSNLRKKRGMPIETFTNTDGVLTYSLKNKEHH